MKLELSGFLGVEMGVDRLLTTEAMKGCPQGGALSPFLQNLPIHVQAYAGDMTLLVVGRNLGTVCRHIQRTVELIDSMDFQ